MRKAISAAGPETADLRVPLHLEDMERVLWFDGEERPDRVGR